MGTLTAGQPRLPHYCEHKLPTSCRLSSIGECCACYDERPHAASYQMYIDGVGFVPRGTRWQRYCWFCKEFWANRVQASGLRPGQTRIPETPSQIDFLQRWYEFHQGYRIVRGDDGTEERVAVLGEDFKDVSPGILPRTLDELRAGRERSGVEERERQAAQQRQSDAAPTQESHTGPSLDDTLDQLFQAAHTEENQNTASHVASQPVQHTVANIHAQAMTPAGSRNTEHQARRVAALRRELHRMRNGIEHVISGLRELGEAVPDDAEASMRLMELGRTIDSISGHPSQEDARLIIGNVNMLTNNSVETPRDRTLANIQARVDGARHQVEESRRNRDQAASELDAAEQGFRSSQSRLRQLQSEQRSTENYMRLFGTREEMIAQGEDYESPIGGMFTRAWERFRVAEDVRREQRTLRQVLADEDRTEGEDISGRLAELEARERDIWGVPRARYQNQQTAELPTTNHVPPSDSGTPNHGRHRSPDNALELRGEEVGLEEYYALLRRQNWRQQDSDRPSETTATSGRQARRLAESPSAPREQPNDTEDRSRFRRERSAALPEMVAGAANTSIEPELANMETPTIVAGPPGQQLDDDPHINNDRGLDAVYMLSVLQQDETLRRQVLWIPGERYIGRLLHNALSNSLGWADRENIESILEDQNIAWGSRLPAERNRRRRERGERITFTQDAFNMASTGQIIMHDVEVMAECFQMSGRIRERAQLTGPERLAMLYRLQAGERNIEHRTILSGMLQSDATLEMAKEVHEAYVEPSLEQTNRRAELESDRREAARQGNHSRAELDAQRRATHTVALAASRVAMDAGPRVLFERLAERDEATRAAYQRLQENGFDSTATMTNRRLRETFYRPLSLDDFAASPSASDEEAEPADEARGLDAKDTGRPEQALTDEEMTVVLDCRICYSQRAEICTLPCGHLTMCKWCSELHSPTMAHDHTRPRRAAGCPVCRKAIRQKVRVIRS